MAYETDLEKLRKRAQYEALSLGEKAFYHAFQVPGVVRDIKHKVSEKLGREPLTTEEEIEMLKEKRKEIETESALMKERDQILEDLERKAMERSANAAREKG